MLKVTNLTVSINNKPLVDGICFTINAGEIVGLAGESGCGKTLTALSLLRLTPSAMNISGEVLYQTSTGEDVNLLSLGEESLRHIRGAEIAMIFQEPRQSLNPLMRVGAQIAETLELHNNINTPFSALELLQKLKFPQPEKIMNAWPHQLSGGMCQRVMIAIAAICRPRLLIADEPLTALDAENQKHILSLLHRINREFGTAILCISHDIPLVKDFCSRFLVMREGKITDTALRFGNGSAGEQPIRKQSKGSAPPIITIRNLSNSYVSRSFGLFGKKEVKPVLNNVNLEIHAGEIFGLSGESGCGKTTLARCILGLTKYQGEIIINVPNVKNPQIQMIFQDPGTSLNPVKRTGWLMEEPLIINKIGTKAERSQKVDEMLNRIGLDPSYKTRRVHELSGGQKQRVCIGRSLMLDSKILIADEAVSALDVSVGLQILDLFLELRESLGLTILFISHNKNAVEYLCDRFHVLTQPPPIHIL